MYGSDRTHEHGHDSELSSSALKPKPGRNGIESLPRRPLVFPMAAGDLRADDAESPDPTPIEVRPRGLVFIGPMGYSMDRSSVTSS